MKIKTILFAGLATLIGATACNKTSNEPMETPKEANYSIRLSHSIYQFTRATDTAFEEGDVIGVNIFPGETAWLYNAKFTMENGVLTPDQDYIWHPDKNIEATVTAIYPATDKQEYNTPESFTVQSDQSTLEGYKKSDLLFAKTASKPTENVVKLEFKHALSKVIINIDNQLDEEIADVFLTNLYGTVTYDAKTLETTAEGSQASIKAYKSNDNTWVLIVAPQTGASPKLAITTVSGHQYTFELIETVDLNSGKQRSADVVITPETISTSFTPEIEDWTSDSELNFSQTKDEKEEEPETPATPTLTSCKLTIRVNKAITWYDKYLYTWDANDTTLTGAWPGIKAEWDKEDGNYHVYHHNFDASLNGQTINYIINGNGAGQTIDLSVTLNGAETTVTIESADLKKN